MKKLVAILTLSLLTATTQSASSQDIGVDSSLSGNNKAFTAETNSIEVNESVESAQQNPDRVDAGIIITGPDGKQYKFDAKNAKDAPIIVRDLVKPYLVQESALDENDLYFIGVTLKEVPAEYQALVGAEAGHGMIITGVIDDAPADLAGIQKHDVILEANGEPISATAELQSIFRLAENTPVTLKVRRKLATIDVEIQPILWERLNDEAKIALRPRRLPESMEPILDRQFERDLRRLNGGLDDDLLIDQNVASEYDIDQLQKDLNLMRGAFEARQELILKKLDEIQAQQNN